MRRRAFQHRPIHLHRYCRRLADIAIVQNPALVASIPLRSDLVFLTQTRSLPIRVQLCVAQLPAGADVSVPTIQLPRLTSFSRDVADPVILD